MSGKYVLVSVAVAGVLAVSACGQAAMTGGEPVGVAVAAAQQEEPRQEELATVTLNAVEVEGVGTVLTDRDGFTLYRFNKDSADPPTSNCDGDCVLAWPPVLGEAEDVVVAGMDKDLVGSITRVDGDSQITVGGWPLYRFVQDTKPGEANGQGVDDAWFAVTPEGKPAGTEPEQSEPQRPEPQQPEPEQPEPENLKLIGTELPNFGAALTDQDGFTLYLFTKDSKDPSVPTCYGECAETWPPVLVDGTEPELAGVDPAIVGEVAREDGTRQVTVGGWPVYRYSKDTGPGQTNGHGVGGTWFVIEPAGCKSEAPVQEQEPEAAEAEPDSGTGY